MKKYACYVESDCGDDGGDIQMLTAIQFCRIADRQENGIMLTPEWQQYADLGHVPASKLIAAGWWLTCWGCERAVPCDDDDGNELEPYYVGEGAWCSQECYDADMRRMARRRAAIDVMTKHILARYPWATVHYASVGSPGWCKCFSENHENVYAELRFTGSKTNNNYFCFGCRSIGICRGDRDAWETAKIAWSL